MGFSGTRGKLRTAAPGWETRAPVSRTSRGVNALPRKAVERNIGVNRDVNSLYCHPAAMLFSALVDPIDEAWAQVEAGWGDEEAHRRFVGVCVALDRLPEAGKRYRMVRETDPMRSEAASKQIDRLIGLATQQLQDTRVAPSGVAHKRTLTWAAFFIMLVLMGAGVLFLLRA